MKKCKVEFLDTHTHISGKVYQVGDVGEISEKMCFGLNNKVRVIDTFDTDDVPKKSVEDEYPDTSKKAKKK